MTHGAPPPWWTALERSFGLWVRAPLSTDGGRFHVDATEIPEALRAQVIDDGPGANVRLALYREQGWQRYFGVLQDQFPRVTHVVTAFAFNQIVSVLVTAAPPTSHDLADLANIVFPALRSALDRRASRSSASAPQPDAPLRALSAVGAPVALDDVLGALDVPWSLLSQALSIDEAERRAFRARPAPPWQIDDAARAVLPVSRIAFAPSFSLVRLEWSLAERPRADSGRPARLAIAQHRAIVRDVHGVSSIAVDPLFARLLARTQTETFGAALAHVQAACDDAARARLHAALASYVETAVARGFWIGRERS